MKYVLLSGVWVVCDRRLGLKLVQLAAVWGCYRVRLAGTSNARNLGSQFQSHENLRHCTKLLGIAHIQWLIARCCIVRYMPCSHYTLFSSTILFNSYTLPSTNLGVTSCVWGLSPVRRLPTNHIAQIQAISHWMSADPITYWLSFW